MRDCERGHAIDPRRRPGPAAWLLAAALGAVSGCAQPPAGAVDASTAPNAPAQPALRRLLPTGAPGRYGIGQPAGQRQIEGWNIDIAPDGIGLPPGRGSVAEGRALYAQQCAACHGERGEGGLGDRLAGGIGTLASARPVRTIGSYWPYATTLFDYIRRAMPMNAPQSLNAEQVYALSAYLLHLNGLVGDDATVDAGALVRLRMPNRDGFVPDTRPDLRPDTPG